MKELDNAIKEAYLELETIEKTPFSNDGFHMFNLQISQYIVRLYNEALRISKREKVDVVSPSHVNKASNLLVKRSLSKKENLIFTLGGLLLGPAISNTFLMLINNSFFNIYILLLTVIFGVTGSFLIGYNLSKID